MKRLLWLGCFIALAGCQGGESVVPEAGPAASPEVKAATVRIPDSTTPTSIALCVKKQPITVGFSPNAAFEMFRRDPKTGFEYDDLPPKFQQNYRARTWEEANTGFGEIMYDGDLVAAMYTEEKGTQERVDELVKTHQDRLGDIPQVPVYGKHVTYYFWEKDRQRLMICAFPTGHDFIKITVAMGDDVVMDGLGISLANAQRDQVQVDLARNRENASKANTITAPG